MKIVIIIALFLALFACATTPKCPVNSCPNSEVRLIVKVPESIVYLRLPEGIFDKEWHYKLWITEEEFRRLRKGGI